MTHLIPTTAWEHRRRSALLFAAMLTALIAVLTAHAPTPAAAAPGDDACLLIGLFDDDDEDAVTPLTTLTAGDTAELLFIIGAAASGGSLRSTCEALEGFAEIIELVEVSGEDDLIVQIAVIDQDGEYVANSLFQYVFDSDDGPIAFGANAEGLAIEVFDLGATTGLLDGTKDPVASSFPFSIRSDAPAGVYFLYLSIIEGLERSTANPDPDVDSSLALLPFVLSAFEVLPAPPAPGPAATLACDDGAPVVGTTVTCTLQSAPEFDFVWRASTNPEFATGVVTTDAAGTGTFTFVVPTSALGQEVLVEIVDWLAPQPIGAAGGPVPASVPSGEGPAPVAPTVSVLLLGLALSLMVLRTSRAGRAGGASRISALGVR